MARKITFLILACCVLHYAVKAQYCGFDTQHQHLLATDPVYNAQVTQMNAQWAQYVSQIAVNQNNAQYIVIPNPNGPNKIYQIPVVVHIMLPGGVNPLGSLYNPNDAQVTALIDYMNKAWAAIYASYPDTSSGGVQMHMQFVLAKRDPSCNATTGIDRVDASGLTNYTAGGMNLQQTIGASEASIKALSDWDRDQYVNIWLVNKIDGEDGVTGPGPFVAGFGVPASCTR